MSYLLDTNSCIYLFRGQFDLQRKISQVGISSCYLSEITLAEPLYGVENSDANRRSKNKENLEWLAAAFAGRMMLTGPSFHEYAQQKAALKRIGRTVGEFDLLIGSTAIVHGFTLATRNTKDFASMSGIQLENWIDS